MAKKQTSGTVKKKVRNRLRTVKWRQVFLEALARNGNILLSCRQAKVGRSTVYKHRDRYPDFAEQWDDAIEEGVDVLEARAWSLALNGSQKGVWYGGNRVGSEIDFNTTLLIFLLKANRPEKYRDNFDLTKAVDEVLKKRTSS
jgi:hypothetical protein